MNAIAPAKKTGASLNRHNSNQDRGTPAAFIDAVEARFGLIAWDLAATKANRKAACYYGPDHATALCRDSLKQDWAEHEGLLFLNPPFSNIAPWAKKCASVKDRLGWTLMLVPDARDSNWYIEHVHGKCVEIPLSGRIVFDGETAGFPKSLVLLAYGWGVNGITPAWRWDTSKKWRIKK